MTLQEHFRSLPLEKQDELLKIIGKACLWRGWDRVVQRTGTPSHAELAIIKFCEVIESTGLGMEEYT